jgi:hypothetical protein
MPVQATAIGEAPTGGTSLVRPVETAHVNIIARLSTTPHSMMSIMSRFGSVFGHLEATPMAKTIANSLPLLASLSGIHLIGFMLLMRGAIVSNLRRVAPR